MRKINKSEKQNEFLKNRINEVKIKNEWGKKECLKIFFLIMYWEKIILGKKTNELGKRKKGKKELIK